MRSRARRAAQRSADHRTIVLSNVSRVVKVSSRPLQNGQPVCFSAWTVRQSRVALDSSPARSLSRGRGFADLDEFSRAIGRSRFEFLGRNPARREYRGATISLSRYIGRYSSLGPSGAIRNTRSKRTYFPEVSFFVNYVSCVESRAD